MSARGAGEGLAMLWVELSRARGATAAELSERMGRDPRTIRRWLDRLRNLGFEIERTREGRGVRFRITDWPHRLSEAHAAVKPSPLAESEPARA